MAHAYEAKGDYDKAIELYTKALKISKNPSYVLHDRGMAYAQNDKCDEAISDMKKAMEMNPDEKGFIAQCYNDRGVIYFHAGKYEESWQDVQKALDMGYGVHPDFLEALKRKGY